MANDTPLISSQQSGKGVDLEGALAALLNRFAIDDDNLIPAKVVVFDRDKNLVTVQPLIMWVGMDDNNYSRHQIANIPCLSLGGGGFHISFPLKSGDLGWIFAGDRDISLYKQSLTESPPNTARIHKFQDGIFIPDVMRKYTLGAHASNAMVIESVDGSTCIAISDDSIYIDAPTGVNIKTPTTTIDGKMHITGDVTMDAKLQVTGETAVNGGFSAAGGQPCTLPATTTVNGKTVDGHNHAGVQRGSGNTDPF